MRKTNFLNLLLYLMLGGLALVSCQGNKSTQVEKPKKPNLLFIFTDQQSYDMVGKSGLSQVITPNLDQLADEGIYFHHCVSNYPLCTPMRAMLLSGQHPLNNGCWHNDLPYIPDNGVSFGQALQQADYETAWIGKWHLYGGKTRDTGIPPGKNRFGFDGTFLTNNVTVDFSPDSCFYFNEDNEKVFFRDVYEDHPWELEAQTRQVETWLKEYEGEKPFGLFVSWHPPHDFIGDGCPDIPGRQYNYDVGVLDPSLIDPYAEMDIKLRPDLQNESEIMQACRKEEFRNYMAMVTACDKAVGRLIQILKDNGEYENTLFVFTSDHGDMVGSHEATFPKSKPHDYSVRVPLILAWPDGLPKKKESQLLVGSMDLMPSILGLMNIEIPSSVQGMDLSNAILTGDDTAVESQPLFLYYGNAWKGVYTREWTYAKAVHTDPIPGKDMGSEIDVLFNRVDDPGQLTNLFDRPEYRDIQQKLARLTSQWMEEFGDKGYSADDFNKIMSRADWKMNYSQRPIDLFKQQDN